MPEGRSPNIHPWKILKDNKGLGGMKQNTKEKIQQTQIINKQKVLKQLHRKITYKHKKGTKFLIPIKQQLKNLHNTQTNTKIELDIKFTLPHSSLLNSTHIFVFSQISTTYILTYPHLTISHHQVPDLCTLHTFFIHTFHIRGPTSLNPLHTPFP